MNFMYFMRLLTSSFIKLDFVVDNVNSSTSYGLIKITSSSSTLPFLNFILCSSSLYRSYISQMLSSTYWFPCSLYVSNLSANIFWIWNTWFSILLWIRYHKSSDIPRILVVFIVQLLMLIFRIVSSIYISFSCYLHHILHLSLYINHCL